MNKVIITLEAISEYHEPKPYEHFPSIRVDVYRGDKLTTASRFYHRCEDIKNLLPVDTEAEAIALADEWLAEPSNIDKIIQEVIAAIGE